MSCKRAEYIVHHYIKCIEKASSLYIPLEIKVVTMSFVGEYFKYYGEYSWIIEQPELTKLINVTKRDDFISYKFKMASLDWEIEAHPMGYTLSRDGSFDIFLTLLSTPNNDENELIIYRRLSCKELRSSHSSIDIFTKNEETGWPNGSLSLEEIKTSKLDILTIDIQVQVLRIHENTSFPAQIIYTQLIYYDKWFERQLFEWKIDGDLLQCMKNSYAAKRFESNVYNKMWCLCIAPNGNSKDCVGDFDMFLTLCSLPQNVSKISVIWKIHCKEMDISTERTLDYGFIGNSSCCWSAYGNVLSFEKFKECDMMTISADIHILKMFGNNGAEIEYNDWDKYVILNMPLLDTKQRKENQALETSETITNTMNEYNAEGHFD